MSHDSHSPGTAHAGSGAGTHDAGAHGDSGHDAHAPGAGREEVPRGKTFREARSQPRVRPQFDAGEVARRFLDDMEKGGRLNHLQRK